MHRIRRAPTHASVSMRPQRYGPLTAPRSHKARQARDGRLRAQAVRENRGEAPAPNPGPLDPQRSSPRRGPAP